MNRGMGGFPCFSRPRSNADGQTLSRSFGYYHGTMENVTVMELYTIVNEACEDEPGGIAIEFLYESVEMRLRRRGQQMNKVIADNFRGVLVRGINSGRITANIEEDVIHYRTSNSELIITELDPSSETNEVSVVLDSSVVNEEDADSANENGQFVIRYTDDDNGSVTPLWDQEYVPYQSHGRRRFSDSEYEHLSTVHESPSDEAVNLSTADALPNIAVAKNEYADIEDIVPNEISLQHDTVFSENVDIVQDNTMTNNAPIDTLFSSNVPNPIIDPRLSIIDGDGEELYPNDIISSAGYHTPSAEKDGNSMTSLEFGNHTTDSETGSLLSSNRLSTSARDVEEFISAENTPIQGDDRSAQIVSVAESSVLQHITGEQPIIVSTTSEYEMQQVFYEQPVTAAKQFAEMSVASSNSVRVSLVKPNAIQKLECERSLSVENSTAEINGFPLSTIRLPVNEPSAVQEDRYELILPVSTEMMSSGMNNDLLGSARHQVSDTSVVQYIQREQPVQESVVSGSADVSRDSSSTVRLQSSPSSAVTVIVGKKPRFGFLSKASKSNDRSKSDTNPVLLPVERPTLISEVSPIAHSTPTYGYSNGGIASTPITEVELEKKRCELAPNHVAVIQEPDIVKSRHLQLYIPPGNPLDRMAKSNAKKRCTEDFSHLKKGLSKILYLFRYFDNHRKRIAAMDELHSRLKAHQNTMRSLIELFGDENNLRKELPNFYETLCIKGENYVVLRSQVAMLNFIKIKPDEIEDVVYQTLILAGARSTLPELCDDMRQLTFILNEIDAFSLEHFARFVNHLADEQIKIILKAIQRTPQLFEFNPQTSEVSMYEDVVVIGSSERFSKGAIL